MHSVNITSSTSETQEMTEMIQIQMSGIERFKLFVQYYKDGDFGHIITFENG